MAAVSADGSTVCVLILRLNCRSIAFVVRSLRHGFVFEPPLADEGFAVFFDSLRDLLMRALRSVREEITVLVHGAPLHRYPKRRRSRSRALPRNVLRKRYTRNAVAFTIFSSCLPFRPCWLAYLMVRWVISLKRLSEPR
jgi:hypothetical protein